MISLRGIVQVLSFGKVPRQSTLETRKKTLPLLLQIAGLKEWNIGPRYGDIELPGPDKCRLPLFERVPQPLTSGRQPKMMKRLRDVKGPELVHNKLIHNQYGIMALSGAQLRFGHVEMMRQSINRHIDEEKMFAVWRIDPLWKPITKKGLGTRMGGGKGAIDHYVTPVKAGRVIVELAGYIEKQDAFNILQNVAESLPCSAMVVSKEILEELHQEEEALKKCNVNPFSFEYVVKNNMRGCKTWIRENDKIYFDKYI